MSAELVVVLLLVEGHLHFRHPSPLHHSTGLSPVVSSALSFASALLDTAVASALFDSELIFLFVVGLGVGNAVSIPVFGVFAETKDVFGQHRKSVLEI